MRVRSLIALAVVLLAAAGAALWYARPTAPSPPAARTAASAPAVPTAATAWRPKQVVLVTIDTLRFDRLGLYGYKKRPTSPNLDAWAKQAVVFEYATAPAPWTVPSLGALFTGRYPAEVGAYTNSDGMHPDFVGLADLFKEEGYTTASFNTHALLIRPRGGFRRGFDTVYPAESKPIIAGEHKMPYANTEPHLMRWLEKHTDSKFFLWIHNMDPHLPPTTGNAYLDQPEWSRYDAEVRWMDEAMGRLFAKLRELGFGKDLLIVFTADHGEAFGEHGLKGHQDVMYEEVLRVPLIVQYPAMGTPRRIAAAVELIDVYATIAELAGLPLPKDTRSESLVPMLNGARTERVKPNAYHARYFFEDGRHWLSVRDRQWKLLAKTRDLDLTRSQRGVPRWSLDDPETYFELYRIDQDPAEEHDLFEKNPEQVARLQQLLADWGDSVAQGPTRAELDDATKEALRALGY